MKWTAAQHEAIAARGGDVLVSAAAGSGKTAVLAGRFVHLAVDAQPACSVDRILVVTFTEAAAEEMRTRIWRFLRERQRAQPHDAWVGRQLALLDAAQISTLHAFCRQVLVRYFDKAGLDPTFDVLDAPTAASLREECARELIRGLICGPDDATDAAVDELMHDYAAGREERFALELLRLDAFLESVPERRSWCAEARRRLAECGAADLGPAWHACRVALLRRGLDEVRVLAAAALDAARRGPAADRWLPAATWLVETVDDFCQRLEAASDSSAADRVCAALQAATDAAPSKPRRDARVKGLPPAELAAFDQAGEVYAEAAKRLTALVTTDARFTTADWAEGLARIAPRAATLLDLVERFRLHYAARKAAQRAVDFTDLETHVLDLLRAHRDVARHLRDRYEHVLVDEFQDVNPVQAEILRLVSRAEDRDRDDNLFCVGDVKQSIYGFRLAEPELFFERLAAAGDAPRKGRAGRVDLTDNFRSQAGLIRAINAMMSSLMSADFGGSDYDERARLRAAPPATDVAPGAAAMEVHLIAAREAADSDANAEDADEGSDESLPLERIEREAAVVAQRIAELRRTDARVVFGDIVILMRAPVHRVLALTRALTRAGVPVVADRSSARAESLEVRDLVGLLECLHNPRQDIPLAGLLRSPLLAGPDVQAERFPLTDADLLAVRRSAPGRPFHECVFRYAAAGTDAALRESVASFLKRLSHLRDAARRLPLAELLVRVEEQTHYSAYVEGLSQPAQRRAAIFGLLDAARVYTPRGHRGLAGFLDMIRQLATQDLDLPGAAGGAPADAVRVMSIHRSKGLEFPYVFLVDPGSRFNLDDARRPIIFDRHAGLGLRAVDMSRGVTYTTLAHRTVWLARRRQMLEEELRLLYVALTRARRQVFIVGEATQRQLERLRSPGATPGAPLPLARRLGARCMLDWIVDALAGQPDGVVAVEPGRSAATAVIACRMHAAADHLDSPVAAVPARSAAAALDYALGLDPHPRGAEVPAPAQAEARRIVADLERTYAHPGLTAVPSVVSVTELKRRWDAPDAADDPAARPSAFGPHAPPESTWRVPAFAAPSADGGPVEAAERGTWTHLFLQHVDLSRPCDAVDLAEQCRDLQARLGLLAEQVAAIDVAALAWFFDAPAGRELRRHAAAARRELPFILAVEPTRFEPRATPSGSGDFIVVRGMIDCVYRTGAGLVVLDWKTDRVDAHRLPERITLYRPQLDIYARAATALFVAPVAARRLVFLTPRQVVDV